MSDSDVLKEDPKWYVLHTYSGYESMVQENLYKTIDHNNLQDFIVEVKIPMEDAIEEKNGKKKVVQRKDGVQITHTILNNGKTNTLTEISAPRGSILIRHMPSERVSKYKVSGFSGAKTASSDTFFSDLSPEQEKILKGYILGRNNDENTVRQIFQG